MSRLMLCAVTSWLVMASPAAGGADDDEEKSAEAVKRMGGRVYRDEERPGNPVVKVDLFLRKVTDADLKNLTGLKNLKTLILAGTKITDAGLRDLAPLKSLTDLDLI